MIVPVAVILLFLYVCYFFRTPVISQGRWCCLITWHKMPIPLS